MDRDALDVVVEYGRSRGRTLHPLLRGRAKVAGPTSHTKGYHRRKDMGLYCYGQTQKNPRVCLWTPTWPSAYSPLGHHPWIQSGVSHPRLDRRVLGRL
jgi:hypothetical protein